MSTPATPARPNPMDSGPYRSIPLAAVILGFAVVAVYWTDLPETIPIHYNWRGEADGFGSKWLLWLIPVINFGIFVLARKSMNPEWQKYNVPLVKVTEENAERQQQINQSLAAQVRLITCVLLAYLSYTTVLAAVEGRGQLDMGVFWGLLGLLFLVIAVQVYRSVQAK